MVEAVTSPRRLSWCIALALCWFFVSAQAATLPKPDGKVILTITGEIGNTNNGASAEFDRAMLENLGESTLTTWTPWTEGDQVFQGILVRTLLESVGSRGKTLSLRALNDYVVDIPVSDFIDYPVVAALKRNGKYLRVRDKGPIWIVYPRDDFPELQTSVMDQKWIWQLKTIHVK